MAKTTELMAVNEILTACGEIPIQTLSVASNSDAAIALDTLRSIKTEVEQTGWWFNSFYNIAYAPSGGIIAVPANVLSLKPSAGGYSGSGEPKHIVEKDNQLYDVIANTATFASSVSLDVILSTDFENLPESARRYITVRAARIAQQKILGDPQLGLFTELHEKQAFRALEGDEAMNKPGGGLFLARAKARAAALMPDPIGSTETKQRSR